MMKGCEKSRQSLLDITMRKKKINEKTVYTMFCIMMLVSILLIIEAAFLWGREYLGPLVSSYINVIFYITTILFIVVVIITAVMQIAFWLKKAHTHLSQYKGAQCFEHIDFLNRNLGECNEYYRSRIREIKYIYKNDPELQVMVEEADLESLYARKAYLENQLDFFDNVMQIGIALGVSFLVAIIEDSMGMGIISEILFGVFVVVCLCVLMIAKYIGKGRGDSYTYNMHQYEVRLLNKKIHLVNKKLCANEEVIKILEMRQAIVNVLADIYGSRRKRKKYKLKKNEINNMVQILYKLPLLEIGDKVHLIWAKRKIGESKYFFPVRIEKGEYICFNESYQKVDEILQQIVLE